MIATMSVQSHLKDPLFSRNSNSAGSPLPGIPRRTSSALRPKIMPLSPPESSSMPSITVVVHQSTPPLISQPTMCASPISDLPSVLEPSERPTISISTKQLCPPEQSTPTPAVHNARLEHQRQPQITPKPTGTDTSDRPTHHRQPLIYTPGVSLRLTAEHLKTRNFSESHARPSLDPLPQSASSSLLSHSTSATEPRLVRKKSGQLVKSSLKSSKSLSVVTRSLASKSEPNTPTHTKAVHFDAQLEHVKLFLAEQKPLAVSRDGSPTEDTSGTDTDFPSFIFGPDGDNKRKNLVLHTPNMHPRPKRNADVALEELKLGPDALSIVGKVRVRNIAFAKWVVARFTFDEWQTTSEVTALYSESLSTEFDLFIFSVRLNDLLARIEGKKMWLAVRYSVGDKEMWDNNDSRNYLVEFSVGISKGPAVREREREKEKRKVRSSQEENSSASERDIADLRSKLEKVVVQTFRPKQPFPTLAARYDFGSSLTEPWKPSPDLRHPSAPHAHVRTQSHPLTTPTSTPRPKSFPAAIPPVKSNANSIPWPEKAKTISPPLGSPRDVDEDVMFATHRKRAYEVEDAPFAVPSSAGSSVSGSGSSGRGGFRHHRRGYFDGARMGSTSMKRTPPGTPPSSSDDSLDEEATPTMTRFYSFPPAVAPRSAPAYGLGLRTALYGDGSESSEQSTPSLSSSRDSSPSPTESMSYGHDGAEEGLTISPGTNYREFLTKFCFFTGTGVQGAQPHILPSSSSRDSRHHYAAHTRAHTHPHSNHKKLNDTVHANEEHSPPSDLELFLTSASPRLHHEPAYVLAPTTASVSLDDIASLTPRSGSATSQLLTSPTVVAPAVV